jgi:hypothetical protein
VKCFLNLVIKKKYSASCESQTGVNALYKLVNKNSEANKKNKIINKDNLNDFGD